MKELLENLDMIDLKDAEGFTLIDTCYMVHVFEHPEHISKFKEELSSGRYGITSFNIEELMHIEHRLNKKVKEEIRQFLKEHEQLEIIKVDAHPGDVESEKVFIDGIEPNILKVIRDTSDGVMYAAALKAHGNIITRDKHHIYNQISERFANKHKIEVRNKI